MPIQRPWNDHEAVILLEALIKVLNGEEPRKHAIKRVSSHLRKLAIDSGLSIDDVYRNENGITFQMHSMESAYRGYTVMKPASSLFTRIVLLRESDFAAYNKLVKEAMGIMDNRKSFSQWLSEKSTKKYSVDALISVLDEATEYCKSHSLSKKSFWDMTEACEFTAAASKLLGMKFYRLKYKNTATVLDKAVPLYKEYLNQCTTEPIEESIDEETRNKISQKLYSLSKIYDDPTGFSVERIVAMLGNNVEEQLVADILEGAPWATRLSDNVYSFSRKPNPSASIVDTKSAEESKIITDTDFFQYLHLQLGLADATCRSYVSAIRTAESYAMNIGVTGKIYGCTVAKSLSLMQTLLNDANFREFNIKQHNRFTAAFRKLSEMIGLAPARVVQILATAKVQSQEVLDDYDAEKFKETLLRRYGNGMQFDSIDFDNFREMYEMLYDEKLVFSDAELEKRLRDCGVVYQDRLFPSEGIIDIQTRARLFEYIERSFSSGNTVLYYRAIFSDLSDVFAYCFSLTDEMMLKAYIEYEAEKGKYYFFSDYMSTEKDVEVNHTAEITEYLLSAGKPLSLDEIYSGLSHVSSDLIYREIQTNPDFMRNEKSHYFHISMFELSQEEADQIASYISEEIDEDGYAIWNRIFIRIQDDIPVFLENNLYLSSLGIRNALARKLDDRFNFDSEVICNSNQHLSMGDVYTLFARHHAPFSDVDLYNFSKEIGTVIYFWSVAEEAVRVSKELFVQKKQIEFDIVATDKALGTYLSDGYILAKDVDSFLVFPNVGYEWNVYLLESYLMHYSKKYTLVNNGTSLNNVAGAVVKQGGVYSEFVDICADVLANSDIELKKDSALDYLAMQNLITRRSYRDIDVAITKARQIRNRKG